VTPSSLPADSLLPNLQRLSGIFDVKIFPDEWSIRSLRAASKTDTGHYSPLPPVGKDRNAAASAGRERLDRGAATVDVVKLSRAINAIDLTEVRRRKHLYNRLYHEAMIESERERGISFSNMLVLLAHYRLIDDDKALRRVSLAMLSAVASS
jgi:hypothetical protein